MPIRPEQFLNARPVVGRFAPSPTGRMHAGNIYAALCAWLIAKSQGGSVVLRIEDLDRDRSKPEFIDAVMRDFEALGLTWDKGPFFQHDRDEAYAEAFARLDEAGLLYPCYCTRADLHAASAPHAGEHFVYPRTCLNLTEEQRDQKAQSRTPAIRIKVPAQAVSFHDQVQGQREFELERDCGDFIVRRFDQSFAYQLAVVVDDAAQGVTSVVRGCDLLSSTPQQIFLQRQLGLPEPTYAHIPLLVSSDQRRLAKRDKDAHIDQLLEAHGSYEAIVGHIAALTGIIPEYCPTTPEELLRHFSLNAFISKLGGTEQIDWA